MAALSPRYALDVVAMLGGGFLAVSAMTFSAGTAGWLAFGVSAGIAVLAAAGAILNRRTSARIGHGVLAVAAVWSLVAALVFAGPVLTWLVFADAVGLLVVALADLTVHEVTTERVVHAIDVRTDTEAQAGRGLAA
jgi:hypothetical protein